MSKYIIRLELEAETYSDAMKIVTKVVRAAEGYVSGSGLYGPGMTLPEEKIEGSEIKNEVTSYELQN